MIRQTVRDAVDCAFFAVNTVFGITFLFTPKEPGWVKLIVFLLAMANSLYVVRDLLEKKRTKQRAARL